MRSDRGAHGAAGPTSTAHKNTLRSACYDAGVCKGELLTAAEITKQVGEWLPWASMETYWLSAVSLCRALQLLENSAISPEVPLKRLLKFYVVSKAS